MHIASMRTDAHQNNDFPELPLFTRFPHNIRFPASLIIKTKCLAVQDYNCQYISPTLNTEAKHEEYANKLFNVYISSQQYAETA